ncbi:MAG: ABC transporter transmembrane domain-containing protein, partial [Proteobacteria bacterium]|nr:ABC transporter transmembrane domain-containing protein [Pseudomonadota bacterium]
GIRIVKFFAWEPQILKEVKAVRNFELNARRRVFHNNAYSLFIHFTGSLLVGLTSFATALALGQQLSAATIFACLAVFGLLDSTAASLTELISNMAAARVSADRLASFLREPTLVSDQHLPRYQGPIGIEWNKVSYRYEDAKTPVLHNLQFTVAAAQAVAIVGHVGAGKSSLLLGLLGELNAEGKAHQWLGLPAHHKPHIAYVPQDAFIINGSLRENILLSKKDISDEQLHKILYLSCLEQDCRRLPGGLSAEIGEQGINLSGGQKQRVNLARAIALEPSVVLLDDPLSAVDFDTEDQLVERLVFGHWQGITRLMVTHRLQHLHRFDHIVFIEDGHIIADGKLEQLLLHSEAFRRFYTATQAELAPSLKASKIANPDSKISAPAADFVRLTDDEDRALGAVGGLVYKIYGRALLGPGSWQRWTIAGQLAAASLLSICLPLLQNTWLAYWANHKDSADVHSFIPVALFSAPLAISLWGILGFFAVLAAVMNQVFWLRRALIAGAHLHDLALKAVLKAPLSFFNQTPLGRILNRFSRDVDSVERDVASNLDRTLVPIFHALAAMFLLCSAIPIMFMAIVPALYAYYSFQKKYRKASRDAQRLMSISRSPRFAFFKETLQNTSLIRAHGQAELFSQQYQDILGHFQRMFYGVILLNRWFSSRIPLLGGLISFGLITSLLFLSHKGQIAAGTAGLTLVYALRLWEHLNSAIRNFTMVESNMISVERLQHFQNLEAERDILQEPPLCQDKPWPTGAKITLENLSV